MGILRRFAALLNPTPATRAASWDNMSSGLGLPAQTRVDARAAENLSAVLGCVSAISTAISALPAYVYRMDGKSRAEAPTHPLAGLIRKGPNRWQTWPDFMEWWTAQTLLRGNGLAEIITDHAGRVIELIPIPWEWVTVQLLPSGRIAYDVTEMHGIFGSRGRRRRLLSGEVLHLKDRTDEGLIGRSRLHRGGAVVGSADAIHQFARSLYENGVHPSGVLTTEARLVPEQRKMLADAFREAFAGPRNAAKVLLFDQGMKWDTIGVTPEDAELLASRKFTTEEICRLYQVPPQIVQDHSRSTFTNSETAGRWFAQFCLLPWIRKIEAEFARSLFTDEEGGQYALELDMSAFDRGDPATRWQGHAIAVSNGILLPNEVREVEGWNPLPRQESMS